MLTALALNWIKGKIARMIARKVRKAMFKKLLGKTKGKLTYAGIAGLVVGLVSQLLGVDIAPAEVDTLMTAIFTASAIYGRYRVTQGAE